MTIQNDLTASRRATRSQRWLGYTKAIPYWQPYYSGLIFQDKLTCFVVCLTLKATTRPLELSWRATTRKSCVCQCVRNLAWSSVAPKVCPPREMTCSHTMLRPEPIQNSVFCFGRGPMSGPHHHRRPPSGSGGSGSLSAAPGHLRVQRGPLHHLLWERSLLQLQHQWKTAGTDGGQRFHPGEMAACTHARPPACLLFYMLKLSSLLSRPLWWAAMATTWSRVEITAWWRCGRPVTSNSSMSTLAVMQASGPWTSHTTKGQSIQCVHVRLEADSKFCT